MAHFDNILELKNWIIQSVFITQSEISQTELRRLTTVIERCEVRYLECNDIDRILGSTSNLFRWVERNLAQQGLPFYLKLAENISLKVMNTVQSAWVKSQRKTVDK
jgi:hypothetical protein